MSNSRKSYWAGVGRRGDGNRCQFNIILKDGSGCACSKPIKKNRDNAWEAQRPYCTQHMDLIWKRLTDAQDGHGG